MQLDKLNGSAMAEPSRRHMAPIDQRHELEFPSLLISTQENPLHITAPTQQPRVRLRRRQTPRLDLRARSRSSPSLASPPNRLTPRPHRLRDTVPFPC